MARLVGKNGSVKVDGSTIARLVSWEMTQQATYHDQYGASSKTPTTYVGPTRWSGSFEVEADPGDSTQSGLRSATPVLATLQLREASGEGWSITAYVTGGISMRRAGKVVRRFSFRDTGSVSTL
jgi:hypothetical protein